jgi:2-polyprenyl-6-hydroxyphenyl methylase/3-demethylubiquinone-9 3-methyltransferase
MTVAQYYQTYWESTDDVSKGDVTTPRRRAKLLDVLACNLSPGDAVLDLGCGAGIFTRWIQEAGFQATGVDVAENALERARKNAAPQCQFLLMGPDGKIPGADEQYHAVWSTEVIEHVLDVSQFLREIHRVLRPKGLVILTTPYHGLLKNLLIVLRKFDGHFDPEGPHIRFFDKRGLDRCLRKAGFIPLLWQGIGRIWPLYRTWFVVARKP